MRVGQDSNGVGVGQVDLCLLHEVSVGKHSLGFRKIYPRRLTSMTGKLVLFIQL